MFEIKNTKEYSLLLICISGGNKFHYCSEGFDSVIGQIKKILRDEKNNDFRDQEAVIAELVNLKNLCERSYDSDIVDAKNTGWRSF